MSRRARYALIAGIVVPAVIVAIVAVLLRAPPPAARLDLDQRAERPEPPAVSARYASWTDRLPNGRTGVMLYDSATGETRLITPRDVDCSQPAIAGDSVVYVDSRSGAPHLYRYDVPSGTSRPFAPAAGRQSAPSSDGEWVVWEDDRTGFGPRVRARRVSGGAEVVVPGASPGAVQRRPQVGGGFVVFEEYAASALGGGNAAIFGYDLARGKLETIAASPAVHLLPDTDGRSVAWCEQRGSSLNVVVLDRNTGMRSSPPSRCAERTTPAVSKGVAYWVERCGVGHFEVYAWRVGSRAFAPLPGPGSIDQVDIRASGGSRAWLELRQQRWYVRAELTGRSSGASASASAAAPASETPLPPSLSFRRPLPVAAADPPLAPPGSPVASVSGTSSVLVTWQAATGAAGYDVYRYSAPITSANAGLASKVASVSSSAAIVPVAPGEAASAYTLYYAVAARDAAGNTALSVSTVPDPHGTSAGNTLTCQRCHLNPAVAPNPATRQACYACHGSTPNTTRYGAGSSFDVQAAFRDDTAAPLPPQGSRHRNAFMTESARECDGCHSPHRRPYDTGPAASYVMLLRTQIATATSGQAGYRYSTAASPVGNQFCFDCHGTSLTAITLVGGSAAYLNAAGDHETGWGASAHGTNVAALSADPGIQCLACHDQHGSSAGALLGVYDPAANANLIAGSVVTGDDNSVCLACHASASAGWPSYGRDASGFPVSGTWPGAGAYNAPYDSASHAGGIHARSAVVWPGTSYAGGDCKNCHRMHGPSDRYDILRDTDPSGNPGAEPFGSRDFSFCFICHDGSPGFDIRSYYPPASGGLGTSARAGHATVSNGTLPAGSALPCYDCHDPHGTGSSYGLLVQTMTSATATIVVGDAAGELTMGPGRSDANVRQFCLTCHTTADTAAGWNGSAFAGVSSSAKVEGIDRVSPLSSLRLPSRSGHNAADAQSCYACHGSDYSSAAGTNVHDPGSGVSNGGIRCYTCHAQFKETMDLAGTSRTAWYHHVLGTGAYNGDIAPGTGSYPSTLNASAQEVYCVSCHADHNYFNAARGANLRLGIALGGSATTNTDFVPAAPFGICVSCHSVSFSRDNADQRAGGGPSTLAIVGADYGGGAHDYAVQSSFSGSAFQGNCSKCHSDGQPASYQGTTAFSLHFSLDWRLFQAMGLSVPATWTNTGAPACYRCHSTSTADNPNTGAGKDWYGIAVMTLRSRSVRQAVSQTYSHPVDANPNAHTSNEVTPGATWPWSNRHVTCADCHDAHASSPGAHTAGSSVGGPAVHGAAGVRPSWAAASNFAVPTTYTAVRLNGGSTDWEAYLCFKCHSSYGGTPTGTSPSGAKRTNTAQEFNPANFSYHRVLGTDMSPVRTSFVVNGTTYTWPTPTTFFNSPWTVNYMLTCSDCHTGNPAYARGPHGSSVQFMIDPAYPVLWGSSAATLQSSSPGMSSQLICAKCHLLFSGMSWGNSVHAIGEHRRVPCTACHVGVPHGWKRPRLIGYTTDPAPYGHTSGAVQMKLRSHTLSGGRVNDWQVGDCATNCGEHGSSVSPAWP